MTHGRHKRPVLESLAPMVSSQPVFTELVSQEHHEAAEEEAERSTPALCGRRPLKRPSVLCPLHSVGSAVCPFVFPTYRHTHAHTHTQRVTQTHTHIYTNTRRHTHFQGLLGPEQCLWQTFQILRSAYVTVTHNVERPHDVGRGAGSRNRVGRTGSHKTRFHPRLSAR